MAILKCKMCGGELKLLEGVSTAECEYCGSVQTVPKADDEKKLLQFERAEKLRKQCEFDKAAGIYESIVADFRDEAEAYWGLVLCKFGIEYVDDPATGKKIPTCHRSSFDSILDDSDFEQAMENADPVAQKVYREEAKALERIRKGILEISSAEQPYDIFICYKETDFAGQRTLDSVLAQDLYTALTDKGYRVFFSRITLKGKLGVDYEPYIFAALNSAKVMLAVGTCYEYYNAVWVKNEWSRYLKICAADKGKYLIPCYRNLDPEDMPKEFKHLQGADLGAMGAIQDILFNMEKYIPLQKPTETVVVQQAGGNPTTESYLERVALFLEDGDWKSADEYCEKVLDIEPKNANAYLGKLMVELKVAKMEALKDLSAPFDHLPQYDKTLRFAGEGLRSTLQGYNAAIRERKAQEEIAWEQRREEERIQREEQEEKARLERERQAEEARRQAEEKEKARQLAIRQMQEKNRMAQEAQIEKIRTIREKLAPVQGMICAGFAYTLGRNADGTVNATGSSKEGQCKVSDWHGIVAMDGGMYHTVGLKYDGTVVAAGKNQFGQCKVDSWKNIVAVGAGHTGTYGLKADGSIVHAGFVTMKSDLLFWSKIVAISVSNGHIVGLKADGRVLAAGINSEGQCEVSQWRDIVAISAGSSHTVGLRADGTVVATKYTGDPKKYKNQCDVEAWKNIVAVSAGADHTVGLKADGTVVAVGGMLRDSRGKECAVSQWKDIVAIDAGCGHTIGLKADGTVVATGSNLCFDEKKIAKWRLFQNFEKLEEERKKIALQWRALGKCRHCGGDIRGLLSKKCSFCGKPKDE